MLTLKTLDRSSQLTRQARELLQSVFFDDPSWHWHIAGPRRRRLAIAWYYRRAVRRALTSGAIDVALDGDRVLGAALWFLNDGTWHLEGIVVSPEARGQSIASKLLTLGLQRVDDANATATLDATSEASKRLYERYGFTLDPTAKAKNPIEMRMVRPAQRNTSPNV